MASLFLKRTVPHLIMSQMSTVGFHGRYFQAFSALSLMSDVMLSDVMWQPPLSAQYPNYLFFPNLLVEKRYFWNLPSFTF